MGKLRIFQDAIAGGYVELAIIGVITSIISVYYYLRPVVAMYFHEQTEPSEKAESAWGLHLTLTLTSAGILLLGLFPSRLFELSLESVKNVGM
jgi:NADH-quinone oxidoreductase subunit N